ncbi:response regulator [Flavobacterium salmonis]|uniref:Regulator of RpoS n=1 Tax=Flavobacterium salmonis TaxID=2654844 RepID=A0A6V6Z4E5_9FLAO|nr:response regulator [Flavobacterium salmonis]CAD0006623.1 Regulator of RpoS [Flavobacterium salmonis]
MDTNKILFVDDEPNIRDTIKELLVFKNYDVRTVANGQEALDVLDFWMPDLIICDIVMPVMNGAEFYENVKKNKLLSQIPFIFLSAKNEIDLIRKCLLDGVDDFLTKPFKINELMLVVTVKLERFEKYKNIQNSLHNDIKKNTFTIKPHLLL